MSDQITKHFTLSELTKTSSSISNTPSNSEIDNLYNLALVLEKVRSCIGNLPMTITSGYRSKDLNASIGGSPTSDHCNGLAVDFKVGSLKDAEVVRLIKSSGIKYDQLILEPSWVHFGIGVRMRQQTLKTTDKINYTNF
jgi:zinc D-Ala-D-Ala carboxypeptidase